MSANVALARRILGNDLRLFFRAFQKKKTSAAVAVLLQLFVLGALHMSALTMLQLWTRGGTPAGGPEFACAFVGLIVLAIAMQRSLEVVFNRGDLPLLLASPVPGRVIVATRLADIVITTWIGTAILVLPLADMAVLKIGRHWAWAWLAWPLGVTALAPVALAVTLAAVRRFGARRAKTFLQIAGVMVGLLAFFLLQAPNWLLRSHEGLDGARRYMAWFDVGGLNQVVAAATGDWRWVLVLGVVGVGSAAWGVQLLGREILLGAQAAGGEESGGSAASAANAQRAWREAFPSEKPWMAVVRKELRVLRRDPLLIARSSTKMVMLLPALTGAFLFRQTVGIAALSLVGCATVAMTLAGLMSVGDEAQEFAATSPISPRSAAFARLLAAMIPPAAIAVVLAVVLVFYGGAWMALAAGVGSLITATSTGWLTVCTTKPFSQEERAANKQPAMLVPFLFALLIGGLGAGGLGATVAGFGVAGIVLGGVALLIAGSVAWVRPPAWSRR